MYKLYGNMFLDILISVLSIIILSNYFGIFFEYNRRSITGKFCWIIYYIWQLIMRHIHVLPAYMNVVISILLVGAICLCAYTGNILQIIVFSVMINTIWMLAEFIIGYMFELCGISYMVPLFLGAVLSELLTLILIGLLKRFFHNEHIRNLSNVYNILLLLIPIGSMFVVYNIFMISVDMNTKQSVRISLASSVIMLVINFIVYKLYLSLSKEKELQKFNAIYEQQIELCNQHIIEKEAFMSDFRKARHDIKQHFLVLTQMLNKNDIESATDYLNKLINMSHYEQYEVSRTGNVIIDSLINGKNAIASKFKIDFEADIHIPVQLPFRGADLSILIGNILDNAIEASQLVDEDKRYIKLYMRYEKNILIMTVINSYNGKISKNHDGMIISNKLNSIEHGIGLKLVHRVTESYHGSMVIETKQDTFVIKILLCDIPKKLHTTT